MLLGCTSSVQLIATFLFASMYHMNELQDGINGFERWFFQSAVD